MFVYKVTPTRKRNSDTSRLPCCVLSQTRHSVAPLWCRVTFQSCNRSAVQANCSTTSCAELLCLAKRWNHCHVFAEHCSWVTRCRMSLQTLFVITPLVIYGSPGPRLWKGAMTPSCSVSVEEKTPNFVAAVLRNLSLPRGWEWIHPLTDYVTYQSEWWVNLLQLSRCSLIEFTQHHCLLELRILIVEAQSDEVK